MTKKEEKNEEKKEIKIETSKRNLKHYFSEDERKKIGQDLAKATQKKYSLEDDKKAVMDQFKSRISSAEFDIKEKSLMLSQGYEFRDIDCEVIRDYVEEKIRFRRLDTDEIVDERDMMPHEKQMEIDFNKSEDEEKEKTDEETETTEEE